MPDTLLVMLGGAIGAGGRFAVAQAMAQSASGFPSGTLLVNLGGGLLIGLLAGALPDASRPLWLFLGPGVLGGFTTFSAFSLDAATLIGRGEIGLAVAYVLVSVAGAIALFAAGLHIARAAL